MSRLRPKVGYCTTVSLELMGGAYLVSLGSRPLLSSEMSRFERALLHCLMWIIGRDGYGLGGLKARPSFIDQIKGW